MRRHHLARSRELYRAKAAFDKEQKEALRRRDDEEAIGGPIEDEPPIDASPGGPDITSGDANPG
jgi:hypothetical protein